MMLRPFTLPERNTKMFRLCNSRTMETAASLLLAAPMIAAGEPNRLDSLAGQERSGPTIKGFAQVGQPDAICGHGVKQLARVIHGLLQLAQRSHLHAGKAQYDGQAV